VNFISKKKERNGRKEEEWRNQKDIDMIPWYCPEGQ
jgi:hypothetical protein